MRVCSASLGLQSVFCVGGTCYVPEAACCLIFSRTATSHSVPLHIGDSGAELRQFRQIFGQIV